MQDALLHGTSLGKAEADGSLVIDYHVMRCVPSSSLVVIHVHLVSQRRISLADNSVWRAM